MINLHVLDSALNNPWSSHCKLVVQVRLRFTIEYVLLAAHLEVVCSLFICNDVLYQRRIPCTSCLDGQLNGTPSIQEPEEEASFVDGTTCRQEAVVEKDCSLRCQHMMMRKVQEEGTITLFFGPNA
jgi:hypothetical protein